jgi:hypothetical protein
MFFELLTNIGELFHWYLIDFIDCVTEPVKCGEKCLLNDFVIAADKIRCGFWLGDIMAWQLQYFPPIFPSKDWNRGQLSKTR